MKTKQSEIQKNIENEKERQRRRQSYGESLDHSTELGYFGSDRPSLNRQEMSDIIPYERSISTYVSGIFDDLLRVHLMYPPMTEEHNTHPKRVKYIDIGMYAVRASNNIRISYDFERDGWKVEMESVYVDGVYHEVAFIGSWATGDVQDTWAEEINNPELFAEKVALTRLGILPPFAVAENDNE